MDSRDIGPEKSFQHSRCRYRLGKLFARLNLPHSNIPLCKSPLLVKWSQQDRSTRPRTGPRPRTARLRRSKSLLCRQLELCFPGDSNTQAGRCSLRHLTRSVAGSLQTQCSSTRRRTSFPGLPAPFRCTRIPRRTAGTPLPPSSVQLPRRKSQADMAPSCPHSGSSIPMGSLLLRCSQCKPCQLGK